MTWGEAILLLNKRYNGVAIIQKLVDELKDIRIGDYFSKAEHEGPGLQLVARRIEKLVPTCPINKGLDKDKKEELYYAFRKQIWALPVINYQPGQNKSYKQFLDELSAVEYNYREFKEGKSDARKAV